MNFKDYKATERPTDNVEQVKSSDNPMGLLTAFLKSQEGKSRDQIVAEIKAIATKSRREGKLSDGELDNFYRMLKPVLKGDQLKILDETIASLKEI